MTSALEQNGIIRTRFTLCLKKEKEKTENQTKYLKQKMFKILGVIQWYSLISERWEVHEVSPTVAPGYYLEFLGHDTEKSWWSELVRAGALSSVERAGRPERLRRPEFLEKNMKEEERECVCSPERYRRPS